MRTCIKMILCCPSLLQELKNVGAEKRLVLDTVNEVGSALLDLVPWRAREGLDRLVADANQRYRAADETITQRVQQVQAAIQRSQQVLHPTTTYICNPVTKSTHFTAWHFKSVCVYTTNNVIIMQ